MSDNYDPSAGDDQQQGSPPPVPRWTPAPPWGPAPGAAGHADAGGSGGGQPPFTPAWPYPPPPYPGGGYPAGSYPVPPAPVPRSRRNRATVAVAAVAAVATGVVGLLVGTQLGNHTVASAPLSSSTPTLPGIPSTGIPSTGNPSTGNNPSSGNSPSFGNPASGGSAPSAAAASIASRVDPGVVDINVQFGYRGAAGAGTGIVLTSSGEVLTNNHVVDGATSIRVTSVVTGRVYSAKVVGTDLTDDVAVIQLQHASGLATVKTADSAKVATGDPVVAIGNAGGVGGTPAVVTGTVQALNQPITVSDQSGAAVEQLTGLIQTNTPIQPGDSGGPLVNTNAQVIGIDTAASAQNQYNPTNAVGFAIPINHALSLAKQIESGQASSTIQIGVPGLLGVEVNGGAQASGSGAVVVVVASGGPAAKAGIVAGDTITSVNGTPVDSAQALTTAIHATHPGDKASVTWTDQSGASHTATVTLASGPPD